MITIKRRWITITHTCGHQTMVVDNQQNLEWAQKQEKKPCGCIQCKAE